MVLHLMLVHHYYNVVNFVIYEHLLHVIVTNIWCNQRSELQNRKRNAKAKQLKNLVTLCYTWNKMVQILYLIVGTTLQTCSTEYEQNCHWKMKNVHQAPDDARQNLVSKILFPICNGSYYTKYRTYSFCLSNMRSVDEIVVTVLIADNIN